MKAYIGFAIEYFVGAVSAGIPAGLLFWLAEYLRQHGHKGSSVPLYILGGLLAGVAFFSIAGAVNTLFFKSDETGDTRTSYYCPTCKEELTLRQMDLHRTFSCPHCGQRIHALGRLLRSKEVRPLSSKEAYECERG